MAKSVAQTREDIATRIGGLRRDRGAATLAGKKFDHAVLTAAESELEALDDVDGERVRLERATATQEWEARRASTRKEIADLWAAFLSAWQDCYVTARTLAERVASLLDVSRKLGAKIHEYTGHSTPIMLQPSAVASRIGGRIAAVMATVPGCRARLGGVQWLGGSLYPPEVNWRAQEVKHLWREIEEIIGGDK